MQPNPAMNTVRGLGIANTIIAAISLVIYIFVAVFLGVIVAGLGDPEIQSEIVDALSSSSSSYSYSYSYSSTSLSEAEAFALVQGSIGILLAVVIWCILMTIVGLVAGILEIRNARNPEKLGGVFGWSIAGAICSFLGGGFGWISMILFIIAAVYANKAKDFNATYNPQGGMYQNYEQQVVAQPQPQSQPQPALTGEQGSEQEQA